MRNLSKIFLLGFLLASPAFAGSTVNEAQNFSDESSEIFRPDADSVASCSWGSYYCPATGESYDYDSARCGPVLKPKANSACRSNCPTACVDTGWVSE